MIALRRARLAIATAALAFGLSVLTGMAMVHLGNGYALNARDRIVGDAWRNSQTLHQSRQGHRWLAAALDAGGNATAGLLGMLGGYCPPAAWAVAAYRGWIGGIVSVDGQHRSRLATPHDAFYYLATLWLQLIPYTLTAGAGINLGFAAFRSPERSGYRGPRVPWLRIPYAALRDAAVIFAISVPLFLVASLFEFLASG